MRCFSLFCALLVVSASPSVSSAADVSVKGAHLCCGACVKAVGKALQKVNGVSDAACDREKKTITFKADSAKSAKAGLRALSRTGFYGAATVDGKEAKYPAQKIKAGTKSDTVALRGAHLCCGGCVKAVQAAMKDVKGVKSVTCDRKKRTITLTGSEIDAAAAVAALNKAGFSARHGKRKKKK